MKIENLKDLQKLIAICRKTGVTSVQVGDLSFNLGPEPYKTSAKRQLKELKSELKDTGIINEDSPIPAPQIEDDGLTEEQLLYWSSQPEEDNQTQNPVTM